MSDREIVMADFLKAAGWANAASAAIPGDASTRSYRRLTLGDRKAILMNAPRGAEGAGEPDGASVEDRRAIGYNALARLAGPNLEAFVGVAQALTQRGFSAPEIYAADMEAGLALIEDFGGGVYAKNIARNSALERPYYEAAVDALAAIYRSSFPSVLDTGWQIRTYDEAALLAETDLFLDFYAPDVGATIDEALRADFYALWRKAFTTLDHVAPGLCLRDYHAENLFWLPEREHEARVGLIDFQDALFVHPAYDLASFLEDARRDVDPSLYEPLKQRFCERAGLRYDDDFQAAYAVMATQRNTKVVGFPVRADVTFGKPQYRALIPRIRDHLQRDLAHPALADIRRWVAENVPECFT